MNINGVYNFFILSQNISDSLYKLKHIKKRVLIKHCLAFLGLAQNQHPGENII